MRLVEDEDVVVEAAREELVRDWEVDSGVTHGGTEWAVTLEKRGGWGEGGKNGSCKDGSGENCGEACLILSLVRMLESTK